jgi:hypothetical protein
LEEHVQGTDFVRTPKCKRLVGSQVRLEPSDLKTHPRIVLYGFCDVTHEVAVPGDA